MSSNYVIAIPPTSLVKRIVIPAGLKMPITAILWGAGGGGGGADAQYLGGAGAGGQGYKVTFNAEAGDVIDVAVGNAGSAGTSSRSSAAGGAGGTAYVDSGSNRYKGGAGGTAGSGGSSGGGGGGGGASTIALNGVVIAVAAGGGGGGGAGNTGLYTTGPSDFGTSSQWHAVTFPSWSSVMNQYAIWKGDDTEAGTQTFSTTFYASAAGSYSVGVLVDNSCVAKINDITLNSNIFNNNTPGKTNISLTAGVHTITVSVTNAGSSGAGNPGGFAMGITDPNGNLIWDTRRWAAGQYSYVIATAGGTLGGDAASGTSTAGSSTTGAAGTNKSGDGGGGGGGGGGKNGGTGGTTRSGDQGAYAGGTGTSWRHPSLTLTGTAYPASARTPTAVDSYTVDPTYAVGGAAGAAGKAGYAMVIAQSSALPYVKDSDEWYQVEKAYVKVGDQWRDVSNVYTKQNGQWNLLSQTSRITTSDLSAGVNFG